MLVQTHNAVCGLRVLLFNMVPDDDLAHQLAVGVAPFFVFAFGARE